MNAKVFVGNLDFATTSDELQSLFAEAGEVLGGPPLAGRVGRCLRVLASGLQELVQDLPHEDAPVMRQRFLRSLRRALAHLDGAAS